MVSGPKAVKLISPFFPAYTSQAQISIAAMITHDRAHE
jgi:hypothetical protein